MPGHNKPGKLSGQELLRVAEFRLMAEEQIERLGRAIRRRRENLGLSIPQLAARLPVDPKTIERWELARTGGAMESLAQVANALETTADDLLANSLERPAKGPTPDPFADEATTAALLEALQTLDEKVDALRVELLAALGEVRSDTEALLRRQAPGEHGEVANGN